MSTNYYAHGPFPGGDTDEGLHIGQTAAGWRFLYRSWPEHGLTTAKTWYFFLLKNMSSIRDEYDRPYTLDEFRLIADRTEDGHGRPLKPRWAPGTEASSATASTSTPTATPSTTATSAEE